MICLPVSGVTEIQKDPYTLIKLSVSSKEAGS